MDVNSVNAQNPALQIRKLGLERERDLPEVITAGTAKSLNILNTVVI